MSAQEQLTYFARSWGDQKQLIGISQTDRRYHFLAIGRTGTGKSTLLFSKIVQDLKQGRGLALIDPHGDLAEAVLPFVPKKRRKHLVYLNASDFDYPVGLNILERVGDGMRHLVAANLMSIFRKSWIDSWGPRMAYLLHNSLLALLENRGTTLLSLTRLLSDEDYRDEIVRNVSDPVVRHYWENEFARYPDRMRAEVISPVQNKVGAYVTNRPLRNILGQSKSSIDFNHLINHNGILIANLAKGKMGEDASNLLGSLLVTKLQLAAMGRADIPEDKRRDFYLYVDEFHNFTTESFIGILAEARKYRLNLILAHQYLGQLDVAIRDAVLANIGTLAIFRVGPEDAQLLAKEFGPEWPWSDLLSLNAYEMVCKVMRRGNLSGPVRANTIPPSKPEQLSDPESYKRELIAASRRRYSRPRDRVERAIELFFGSSQSKIVVTARNRRK